MTDSFLFPAGPTPAMPVVGEDKLYPINRIFCVGRNYRAHALEMGVDPDREPPFYFTKSPITYVPTGSTVPYPPGTDNYHHEMELVVAIGQAGFRVKEEDALSLVYGYTAGLDMTRRDLQLVAREKGRPWDLGKDFEQAAVASPLSKAEDVGHPSNNKLSLNVNGETRQATDLTKLIWSVPELVANLSQFYHLAPGDPIYTGTPEGVGPVVAGDQLEGEIEGIAQISLSISEAEA